MRGLAAIVLLDALYQALTLAEKALGQTQNVQRVGLVRLAQGELAKLLPSGSSWRRAG